MARRSRRSAPVALYSRVSTDDQAESGLGLADQLTRCEAYVEALDLGEGGVEVFTDAGVSAKSLDRPALADLLAAVRARRVSAIVVLKLDRLTRRLRDLLELVDTCERYGVSLHSVTERIDTGSAAGRMMLAMLGAVAEWERETISERTAAAVRAKRRRGEAHGFDPLGAESVRGRLRAVAHEVDAIDLMRTMRHDGASLREIARELERRGVPTKRGGQWRACTVLSVLRRVDRDGFVAGAEVVS